MVSRDNMCDFSDVMGPFLFKVVKKVTKVIWNYNYGKNISVRNKNHELRFEQFNNLNFIVLGIIIAFGK